MKRCLFAVTLLVVFAFFVTLPAAADNLYASIRGTVTDQTGAVLTGVKVTVTNVGTGIDYPASTNKDGLFVLPQVPIGDYRARIEQTGFKAFQQSGIHVDLNQVYTLDVKLVVGAASEEIVVEANPVQVETTSMQQGTVVSGSQIVDMPLNGRDWTQLQQLEPGVVAQSDRFNAYSTNGSGAQQNSFLINGTDTNDVAINTHLVSPSPDAIGEFNMVTSTINPEFGRNSGAIINATIKNGTNQFHGDGFEFYRDTFLDAANFTENNNPDRPCGTNSFAGDCRTPFHRNQYGGTFGGPIVKDKAFFFFSYQGLHERAPQVGYGSTPVFSTAQAGGDFSQSGLGFSGNSIPYNMYGDSASPCPVSGGTPCVAGATNPATSLPYAFSDLFSTGVIPTQDFDALAVKLMNQYVPAAGNASSCNNNTITCNYVYNPSFTETDNQYLYRIDYKFRQNDSIWGYGMYETTPSNNTIPFVGANLPGFGDHNTEHTQQYTIAWNHTFSPTTLNEVRFGYLRFNYQAVLPNNIVDPTAYGFSGLTPQTTQYNSLPVMNVTGLFNLGFSSDGPQPRVQNTYHFTDNFSKVIGHHTMKAGFTAEILQLNNPFYSNLYGTYDFNASGPLSSGIPGADFLLGLPSTYEQGSGAYIRGRGREFYTYFQDQWQIRPSLTLTLGAGWDVETPWKNISYGGETMVAWRPGQQSTRYPSMPAGFVYPGDAGINQYGGPNVHYDDIGPRAGFAWSPWGNHNWSIRGGVGLYFNRSEEELILQGLANPPFALSTGGGTLVGQPVFESPMNGYVASAPGTIQNPIYNATGIAQPYPYYAPAAGASFNPALFYPIGYNWNAQDPNLTSPRSTNFNLTIQRQLDKATILSVGYVGSIGRHEEGAVDANQAGIYPGTNLAATTYVSPVYGVPSCASGLYLPNSVLCPQTAAQGGTPYNLSVYGQPGIQATGWNSNYNSMQVGLNRRFSQGLQLVASYTWSRYFDESSSFENSSFNGPGTSPWGKAGRAQMYAPSSSDAPQRLVLSWTYTLPFYKMSHRAKKLTDDWNVSGIYTLQHGFPVPVFDFWSHSLTCDVAGYAFYYCPDRPNAIGKINIINPRTTAVGGAPPAWFTNGASAFTDGCNSSGCGVIPGYTGAGIGTASRNPFYGPGLNYGDIALEKNVHIDESKYFQFRLETFNTFNHTNFCPPANWGACGATPTNDASFIDGSTFGQIFGSPALSTNGEGRVLQLGAKFYF